MKYVQSAHPTEATFTGRAQRIVRLLEAAQLPFRGTILDVGCGHGDVSLGLAKEGFSVIGLDIFLPGVASASKTSSRLGLNAMFAQSSAEHLAIKDNVAELAICYNIWEHVQDQRELLRQIVRVLRTEGFLLLVVPNKFWVMETHYRLPLLAWLPGPLADAYLRITRKGAHYDVHCPTWWGLEKALTRAGFEVQNMNLFVLRNFKLLYPSPEYLGATKYRLASLISILLAKFPQRVGETVSNLLIEAFFVVAKKGET